MPPNVKREEPPYVQIAASIRAQIVSGDLDDGDFAPSARRIAREWKVAQATAQKALGVLRAEGWTRGVDGVGTVINRSSHKETAQARTKEFRRSGHIYPENQYARDIIAELTTAPSHIADALGLSPGSQVICRKRVTIDRNKGPVSMSTSWFDGNLAGVAPDLLRAIRIVGGTPRYVEENTGRALGSGRDQLASDEADDIEAATLEVEAGSPILRSRNWFIDTEGEVMEYGESTRLPRRWSTYEYTISQPRTKES